MDGTELEDEEIMEQGNQHDDGYVGGEDIRTRTNERQLSHLIALMEDHFALASGRSGGTNYAKMQESGWKNVAESLNRLGPPTKDWKSWRKVWNNQTNETRKKVRLAEKYQRDTGGGPYRGAQLTLLQKRIDRFMQISASVRGREGLRFGAGGTTANPENLYRPSEANVQVSSQQSQPGTSQALHPLSSQRSEAFAPSQPEECENNRPGTSQVHPVAISQRDRPGTSLAISAAASQRERHGTSQACYPLSSQGRSEAFEASQPEQCESNRPGTSNATSVTTSQRDRSGSSLARQPAASQRGRHGTSRVYPPAVFQRDQTAVLRRIQPPGAQRRCATAFEVDQPEALFVDSQPETSESNQPELPEVNQSETSGSNQSNPRQSYASRNLQYTTRSNPRQYRTQRNSLMELFANRIHSTDVNNANQQTILNSLIEMQEQRAQIEREQLEIEKKRLEADKENIRLQKTQLDILCKILQNQSGPPGSSDRT